MSNTCSCHEHHEHSHDHDRHVCICGHEHDVETSGAGHDRAMGKIFFILCGGILILNSFALEKILPEQQFAAELSALIGAFILALPIIVTAIKDLIHGKVYMNELVALAILAALASGNFQIAGTIAFFLLLTIIIETRTASGAKRSIEELVKLAPDTANLVLPDDTEKEVKASILAIGDRIRVRPGENFPVDAKIISGESTVNQASITGESIPVEKFPGDEVFAGTQNLTGAMLLEVTKVGEDTTLGQVKDMILQAESSRTPAVRMIDRYAGYYTPAVLMIACICWWFTESIDSVIAFLVIACPCAIVLATPTAVVAAVAAAARLGIFIKNVAHLELASKIRAFVFDKTGTLTDGLLSVVKIQPCGEDITPAKLLQIAASLEYNSNHPAATAIRKLAEEVGIKRLDVKDFAEIHGKGVTGSVDGTPCIVGRLNFIRDNGIDVGDAEGNEENMSIVYVTMAGKLLGWIGLRDKLRREAPEMIAELRKLGIRYCAMVTGDREAVAKEVASALQIDEFVSNCLPQTKVDFVEKIKKNAPVAVVGDGVNDAPALAAGNLSIAMGEIGSGIAIDSASIALMNNDLRRISAFIRLANKSQTIITQNLIFGMIFVFGGMILSIIGVMTPVWAAILHAGSPLFVIFNSARLVRTGEELTLKEKKQP